MNWKIQSVVSKQNKEKCGVSNMDWDKLVFSIFVIAVFVVVAFDYWRD